MSLPKQHIFILYCLLSLPSLMAQESQEWKAPSSPPLFQSTKKVPEISMGLHSSIGQVRPNDGSSLSPAWYSGVHIGYSQPLSHWNFLDLRLEAQTGHITSNTVSTDQDLGINFIARYGTKNENNISLAWIGGVGLAKGQWKSDEQSGTSLLSLFRAGYGAFFPFTESTKLGVSGLLDFLVHRFDSHPTESGASQTQFTIQLSIEHFLPLY